MSGNETIGPFPQEPETHRVFLGYLPKPFQEQSPLGTVVFQRPTRAVSVYRTNTNGLVLTCHPPAEPDPDLLRERDALRVEVEQLRQGVEGANKFSDHVRAQQDALADALEAEVAARRWRPMVEWDQAVLGRLMEIGEEQDGMVYSREIQARGPNFTPIYRHTHFRECLHGKPEQALAALRLAGRLPEGS